MTQLFAPAQCDRQVDLGFLFGVGLVLQLREIAALLARHQAEVFLLERRQLVLGDAQPLLVVLDLRLEKFLRFFRALALATQRLLDEGI